MVGTRKRPSKSPGGRSGGSEDDDKSKKDLGDKNNTDENRGSEDDDKSAPKDERPDEDTAEMVVEHHLLNKNGKIKAKKYFTREILVRNLEKEQQAQDRKGAVMKKWLEDYRELESLKEDSSAKEKLYRDELAAELAASRTKGKEPPAKHAKARWVAAQARVKNTEINRTKFTSDMRRDAHDDWSVAQWQLEDFIYHQDIIRRWKRRRAIQPDQRQTAEADRLRRRTAYMLDTGPRETDHAHWLHSVLEAYDRRGVGGHQYRTGETDRFGNPVPEQDRRERPVVGPDELHLWTPVYRRQTTGLPTRIRTVNGVGRLDDNGEEMFEYDDDHNGEELQPLEFDLDIVAIERRRLQCERAPLPEAAENPNMPQTHDARRNQEVAKYRDTRPNTSNMRVRHTLDGPVTLDTWRNIQTTEGLFIAAKETSWDWLTSYDCLNRISRRDLPTAAPTSAVREEPHPDLGEDDDMIWTRDYPSEDDKDLPHPPPTSKDAEKQGGKGIGKRKAAEVDVEDDTSPDDVRNKRATPARTRKRPKTARNTAEEDQDTPILDPKDDKLWKTRRANIDYGYPKNEFTLGSRQVNLVPEVEYLDVTDWAEETDGRREWHAYRQLSPFSDVDSPPHSPIREDIIEEEHPHTIPRDAEDSGPSDMWQVVLDDVIPEDDPIHKRCQWKSVNCRAWWTHPREECLIVHSENTQRLTNPASDLSAIPPPKTQIIPESGIANYRERLHDHYGVRQPREQIERWPKLGIRVPYEPITFDANKLDPNRSASPDDASDDTIKHPENHSEHDPEKNNFIAKDARRRAVFSMRSLDMPLIKTCQPGIRSWGVVGAEPPPPPRVAAEDESDNEGDMFYDAYHANDPPAQDPTVGGPQSDEPLSDDPTATL